MAESSALQKKVIIIGAGPAGLLAALRFTRYNGLAVTVYEVRSEPTTLGGAIGIPTNGLRLLARLDLYDKLAARGSLTPDMVLHSVNGNELGTFSMASWSEKKVGFSYLRIQRTAMMEVLLTAAEEAGISVHFGMRLDRIEEHPNAISITFKNGAVDSADLLIGADGIHSTVRKLYIEPEVEPKYTGISNLYALVKTGSVRKEASEMTNLNPTLTEDGLFGVSPCTPDGSKLYWFFSREVGIPASGDNRDGWEQSGRKEVEEVKATLLNLLGDAQAPWPIMLRDIVKCTDSVRFYPIFHIPPGMRWHRGRCLIIGDAAHAMPPHASQGVSMAVEDVVLLSKVLRDFPHLPYEQMFSMYEQKRRPRVEKFLTTAQRNGTIRKKVSPTKLKLYEYSIKVALGVYNMTGLGNLGMNQRDLIYDPEDEVLGSV